MNCLIDEVECNNVEEKKESDEEREKKSNRRRMGRRNKEADPNWYTTSILQALEANNK